MKKNILFLLLCFLSAWSAAQWNPDTLVRNAICTAPNSQIWPQLCSDGAKGAIITWTDIRVNPPQIFTQKIDSNGVLKWAANGIVATVGSTSVLPAYPLSDGSNGAIIVYELSVNGGETHTHIQRLDANGNAQWGSGGVRLDTISTSRINNNVSQVIADDGNGGAFVTWLHYLFGTNEIRVQHIDHNGNLLWGPQGTAVSNGTTAHYCTKIINTGNNSCIVAYDEQGKLFMQRINAAGNKMWATDLQVTNNMSGITTNNFYLLNTSSKNIAVAWEDIRNPTLDIYAQKIDTNGIIKWTAGGVAVDNSALNTTVPELAIDNNDGVYVGYGYTKIFVQHLNAAGQLLWGVNGKNVSTSNNQTTQHIWTDGNNGMIVSWEDNTQGPTQKILAQHYDSAGTALWRPNGLPVATTGNAGVNAGNRTLGLNSGRVIAAWEDYRNGTGNQDIFAARFGNNAVLSLGLSAVNTCLGDSTQFNDISTSTASIINYWRWDFGDGSPVGTTKNPKHKYAAAGNYNVTLTLMDDEFNYRIFSQVINISNKPIVNLGNDTSICTGQNLVLNAGNAGAQYLWSTGAVTQSIQVSIAGTYWVKVSNAGCAASDTMVLATRALPVVNLGNDTSICTGQNLVLNAGNAGAQYLWSTAAVTQSIQVSIAGTYWVKVSNAGCAASDTMVLATKGLPVAAFTYVVNSQAVSFTNTSVNATSYNWLFGDGNVDNTTSPAHVYANTGTYLVKLLSTNSCKTDTASQTIIIPAIITTPDSCGSDLSIKLYPNPVHNTLYIKFYTPVVVSITMRILNASGQLIRVSEFSNVKCKDIKQINMQALAAGEYYFEFFHNGKKIVKKITRL